MKHTKVSMSDAESDALMLKRHPRGMTTEQLMDAAIKTVQQMSPDEKAHLRAKMWKSVGFAPKSGGCKPS